MNPLNSISGTIIAGFVLAIVLMIIAKALGA
jgi:tetrahydromethanopterin S-methyltransferase subunit F